MKTFLNVGQWLCLMTTLTVSTAFMGCSKDSPNLTSPDMTVSSAAVTEMEMGSAILEFQSSENTSVKSDMSNAVVSSFNMTVFTQTANAYRQAIASASQYFKYVGGSNPTQDVRVFGSALNYLQNALNLNVSLQKQLSIGLNDPRYVNSRSVMQRDLQILRDENAKLQQLIKGFQMKYNLAVQQKNWYDRQVRRAILGR